LFSSIRSIPARKEAKFPFEEAPMLFATIKKKEEKN